MTMDKTVYKQHGVFSWNELDTSDVNGAKQFYQQLVGWELMDITAGDNGMPYTIAKMGDNEVAGMMTTQDEAKGMPPTWRTYLTVDDVDKRAELAVSLGGKIILPGMNVPDVGRIAIIADPQGAMLGIITYVEEK